MKALIVSHKPPYPSIDGGCMAMANLAEGLAESGVEIGYMCISTPKHPMDLSAFEGKMNLTLLYHRKLNTTPTFHGLFQSLIGKKRSYFTSRFYCPSFSEELIRQIDVFQPDWVILESLFAAVYLDEIKAKRSVKVILRSHNLETSLWKDKLAASNLLKRILLKPLVNRMEKEEKKAFCHADGVLAISEEEVHYAKSCASQTPALLVPIGIHAGPQREFHPTLSFFHLGAMDWEPNISGIQWFIEHVWPSVYERTKMPFHLAGKGLNKEHFTAEGLINHGQVEDAEIFMKSMGILVVPLFQARGLRIKLIEAGSLGIPVIATPEAIGSLPFVHREDLLVAHSRDEFIAAMCELVMDKELQQKLSSQIYHKTVTHFSSKQIYKKTIEFLRTL